MHQYACTCLQNHCIWDKLEFWRDALYTAIQAELVRVYAEVENEEKRRMSDSGAVAGEREEEEGRRERERMGGRERERATAKVGRIALNSSI